MTVKRVTLVGRTNFEFRAEFLNALNNPQFLLPLSNIQAGNAGLVTVANPARNIQLALKYSW